MPRSLRLAFALMFVLAFAVGSDTVATAQQGARVACSPPTPPPPPPPIESGPRGRLTVRTHPEARIFIDGRPAGRTPLLGRYLDAGQHEVRMEASCGSTHRTVRIPAGNDVRLTLALCRGVPDSDDDTPRPPHPPRRPRSHPVDPPVRTNR